MLGLGFPEIAIILVILLLVFGANKLPQIGRGLGSGMREFKDGVTGNDDKKPALPDADVAPVADATPAPEAEKTPPTEG